MRAKSASSVLMSHSHNQNHQDAPAVDPSVNFLYKTMLQRDPHKRRVKLVQKHLVQVDFGLDDSEDDSDFDIHQHCESESEDDIDEEERAEMMDLGAAAVSLGGIFGSVDSSDEDDEDYVPQMKKQKKNEAEKQSKSKPPEPAAKSNEEPNSASPLSGPTQGQIKVLICCVCLSDQSADDDEIVECDNCGISVHEGCYGISESHSTASTESSASTEPWFCDACKAGVSPHCELCPNSGGIYKETDAGKWVHIVCALYTPGVAFGDVDRLCPVTLFEMSYSKWGAKECSLCEDTRFSRTGVCISCDAGMCRSFFHVTCAQKEGLLTEAAPDEALHVADPFFAYCKQHADKSMVKIQRRHWLAIQSHVRSYAPKVIDDEKEQARFARKLSRHREKYSTSRNKRPPAWVPTQKMVRHLHTSPYAVKAFLRKAELMGVVTHVEDLEQEKAEARKKSHITPAFSLEFIQYYFGRNTKIESMQENVKDLKTQNSKLQEQEKILRGQYEQLSQELDKLRESIGKQRKEGEKLWSMLADIGGKAVVVPEMFRPKKRQRSPSKKEPQSLSPVLIHQCGICRQTTDQHLLAKCDSCHKHYHLGCLDPPLTRMPKKTKLMGWQCSQCVTSASDSTDGSGARLLDEPRRLRETIKEPAKYRHMQQMDSLVKVKKSVTSKSKKKKKPVSASSTPTTTDSTITSTMSASKANRKLVPQEQQKLPEGKTLKPSPQVNPIVRLKKEDTATMCVVCNKAGDITNTVRCDECLLSYHFGCLDPPVKKSPKVRGYTWHCEACDPTDQSEEEEEADEKEGSSSQAAAQNIGSMGSNSIVAEICSTGIKGT
ncbi:hypothetical protein C0Q70_02587 [Pomacea canaliculata]|uniref:PHD finger protein 14 n=1 Tax=Pomacea canaliculata TaxID=400727 RepID=A0A2T7PQC7_POMCA|nr:hypothetical protein C0Q70_02587 [Pomacea canaliculata]